MFSENLTRLLPSYPTGLGNTTSDGYPRAMLLARRSCLFRHCHSAAIFSKFPLNRTPEVLAHPLAIGAGLLLASFQKLRHKPFVQFADRAQKELENRPRDFLFSTTSAAALLSR